MSELEVNETNVETEEQDGDIWGDEPETETAPESEEPEVTQTKGEKGDETQEAEEEPETFTLKVNGEDVTMTREELIASAQKGAVFEDVKKELESTRGAFGVLARMAQEAKLSIPDYIAAVDKNYRDQRIGKRAAELEGEGFDSEAAQRMAALEVENEALKGTQSEEANIEPEQIAESDFDEFLKNAQLEDLDEETAGEMLPYVEAGMSYMEAYLRTLLDAAAAQEESAKFTAQNKAKTTGSVRGKSAREDDEAIAALLDA